MMMAISEANRKRTMKGGNHQNRRWSFFFLRVTTKHLSIQNIKNDHIMPNIIAANRFPVGLFLPQEKYHAAKVPEQNAHPAVISITIPKLAYLVYSVGQCFRIEG